MLHTYMLDTEALEFAAHGDQRGTGMRQLFQKRVPGIEAKIIDIAHKAWQEDPWPAAAGLETTR